MLGKTQQTILANGCRIVTAQMDTVESVSVGIDVGVGSRYEGPGEAGFCHFLEHLVFKGSAKRPSTEALMRPIEAVGGSMNAYTASDHTMFFAKVPFDALPLAWDTLFDLVLHPLLRAEDIGRERGVVFSEMDMAHDDDADYANECAQQSAWPGDPLGRPVLGSRDDLSAATDGMLRAFHRTHYTAGGTIIAAAGKLEHEHFVDLVAPYASQIPEGVAPGFRPITAPPPQRRLFAEKRDAQQTQAILTFRAIPYDDVRKSALSVLSYILGGGMTSRLWMSVRERNGLAYMVGSSPSYYADTGLFQVYGGFDASQSVKAISLCAQELRAIRDEGISDEEHSRALKALVGAQRMAGETSYAQMAWIADKTRFLGRMETPDEVIARLSAVTPHDVQAFAQTFFRPDNASLTLVMPETGCAEPEAHLAAMEL